MQVARLCTGPGCQGSLDGRRSHALHCSASCQSAARHQRNKETVQKRAGEAGDALPSRVRTFAEELARVQALGADMDVTSSSGCALLPNAIGRCATTSRGRDAQRPTARSSRPSGGVGVRVLLRQASSFEGLGFLMVKVDLESGDEPSLVERPNRPGQESGLDAASRSPDVAV